MKPFGRLWGSLSPRLSVLVFNLQSNYMGFHGNQHHFMDFYGFRCPLKRSHTALPHSLTRQIAPKATGYTTYGITSTKQAKTTISHKKPRYSPYPASSGQFPPKSSQKSDSFLNSNPNGANPFVPSEQAYPLKAALGLDMQLLHSSIVDLAIVALQHLPKYGRQQSRHLLNQKEKTMAFYTETLKTPLFAGVLAGVKTRLENYRVYRKTLNELQSLSVRELSDLGLNQSMLTSVAHEAAYGK